MRKSTDRLARFELKIAERNFVIMCTLLAIVALISN